MTFFSSSRLQAVKSATIRLTKNINIHGKDNLFGNNIAKEWY